MTNGQHYFSFAVGDVIKWKAHKSAPGKGLSYGAGTGIAKDAGNGGASAGWDVVDVETSGGEMSIYSFSVTGFGNSKHHRMRGHRANPTQGRSAIAAEWRTSKGR